MSYKELQNGGITKPEINFPYDANQCLPYEVPFVRILDSNYNTFMFKAFTEYTIASCLSNQPCNLASDYTYNRFTTITALQFSQDRTRTTNKNITFLAGQIMTSDNLKYIFRMKTANLEIDKFFKVDVQTSQRKFAYFSKGIYYVGYRYSEQPFIGYYGFTTLPTSDAIQTGTLKKFAQTDLPILQSLSRYAAKPLNFLLMLSYKGTLVLAGTRGVVYGTFETYLPFVHVDYGTGTTSTFQGNS